MNGQLGFHHDMRRCMGCRSCLMACRNENRLEPGLQWRDVFAYREDPRTPGRHFLSLSCNHCERPECIRVCPNRAYTKQPDGAVVQDPARCTGCRLCALACPYGAPRYAAGERKTSKCSLCADRRTQGRRPACVDACLTGALKVIDLSEFADPAASNVVPGFPSSDVTLPSVRFTPPVRRRSPLERRS